MQSMFSFSLGLATSDHHGGYLEAFYPAPTINLSAAACEAAAAALKAAGVDYTGGNAAHALDDAALEKLGNALAGTELSAMAALASSLAGAERQAIITVLESDAAPTTVPEAYLKLHLLSHRLVRPHGIDLTGIFAVLPNNAWTSEGPVALDELPQRQLEARKQGRWLNVKCVDKFPVMTDYVVPSGVRIAHTARVRLGAYLGEGTTIMHEGFVNFNAGTEGPGMIEGRISAGVFVGAGADLGGGCSTMGTLSGGGDVIISVGENCLIGANAGIGIGLGDRCTVEAGLYITAGTKVALLDDNNALVKQVKARELNGASDLLFRRNSQSGAVECKTNRSAVELNEALHSHN